MRFWIAFVAAGSVLVGSVGGTFPASGEAGKTGVVQGPLFKLQRRDVRESSGVATSRLRPGIYWTHNDSGDGPNLFAFDDHGADLGKFTLTGAEAFDWEDISSAKIGGVAYLFVADVGDNALVRKSVKVYRVPEPTARPGAHSVRKFDTFELTYPDGASNCETILVWPNGDIQLVTKSADGVCGVYHVASPKKSGRYRLKKLGQFKISGLGSWFRSTTGGDVSADGKRVTVRTYGSAFVWDVENPQRWFQSKSKPVSMPFEVQGEAICFDESRGRFITTSEGMPCTVSFAKIPE